MGTRNYQTTARDCPEASSFILQRSANSAEYLRYALRRTIDRKIMPPPVEGIVPHR